MKFSRLFLSSVLLGLVAFTLPLSAQAPSASPASVTFTVPTLSITPVTQTITLTGVPSQLWHVQAIGGFWLRFTTPTCPGSVNDCTLTTPLSGSTTVTVMVDPSGLPAYPYSGSITVAYPGGVLTIPVNLTVGGGSSASTLTLSPSALTFTGNPGSNSQSQVVNVTSPGTANTVFFNATSNVPWLTTNLDTGATYAPSNVTITANAINLGAGVHQGIISFTPTGGGIPVTLPVTFNAGATQQLVVTPSAVTLTSIATPVSVAIAVNAGANVPYTASLSYPGLASQNWLSLSTTSGVTGTNLTLSATPAAANLPAGTYGATVTIASPGLTPVYLPVTLNFSASNPGNTPRFTADVSAIALNAAPFTSASRTFTLSNSTGAATGYVVTTSPVASWLSITTGSGSTPAAITITANAGSLPAGTYTTNVVVSPTVSTLTPLTIPVTFTVSNGQSVIYSPTSLSFNFTGAGAVSSTQNVQLQLTPSSPAQAASVTAVTNIAGQSWLTAVLLSPTAGTITAGSQIAVTVNAAGLPTGTYLGKVLLSTPSVTNSLIEIPVVLNISGVSTGTTVLFAPPS